MLAGIRLLVPTDFFNDDYANSCHLETMKKPYNNNNKIVISRNNNSDGRIGNKNKTATLYKLAVLNFKFSVYKKMGI